MVIFNPFFFALCRENIHTSSSTKGFFQRPPPPQRSLEIPIKHHTFLLILQTLRHLPSPGYRDLTKVRRQQQRKRLKHNSFFEQQLSTCLTLFRTFLCRPCTTTTWNDQIFSWFENGNGKAINSTISPWTQTRSPLFRRGSYHEHDFWWL